MGKSIHVRLLLALLLIGVFACTAHAGSYALSRWAGGIIVWEGDQVPAHAQHFADRLERAMTEAFGFWGYEAPVHSATPQQSSWILRIHDPATNSTWEVNPLDWNGREIRPVVVFAFASEDSMRTALGYDALYGGYWMMYRVWEVFAKCDTWLRHPGGGLRNLIVTSAAEFGLLVHECAHWFTYEWMHANNTNRQGVPNYIMEGIAELASGASKEGNAPFKRLGVIDWAKMNCLKPVFQGVMRYAVGESLVHYMVDLLGLQGFLDTMRTWSNLTYNAINAYQPGWRASLGLPEQCHQQ